MSINEDDEIQRLCFTARALAQTHPLSESAYRYRTQFIESEKKRQPNNDFVDWASNAVLLGYCLRRTEEAAVNYLCEVTTSDLELLSTRAATTSTVLRSGNADAVTLLGSETVVLVLDRLIATELDKRWDTAHAYTSQEDWKLFEDYLAWAVVHGYCLRISETQ